MEENHKFQLFITNSVTQDSEVIEVFTQDLLPDSINKVLRQIYPHTWAISKATLVWSDDF